MQTCIDQTERYVGKPEQIRQDKSLQERDVVIERDMNIKSGRSVASRYLNQMSRESDRRRA